MHLHSAPAQDFNNTLMVGSTVLQILGIGKETEGSVFTYRIDYTYE